MASAPFPSAPSSAFLSSPRNAAIYPVEISLAAEHQVRESLKVSQCGERKKLYGLNSISHMVQDGNRGECRVF